MNQTNIDYLFQLTATSATRPGDNTRQSVHLPAFDDLFSLASATTPAPVSKTPNRVERTRHEADSPASVSTTYESKEGPSEDQPSSSAGDQISNNDERAETSGAPDQVDEKSDNSGEVAATKQSAANDEDSSNQEELSELPNETEAPIATAAKTATSTAVVDAISTAVATEADEPAETGTGENPTKEQTADKAPQTKERTVKLISHPNTEEIAAAHDTLEGEQSTGTDKTENSPPAPKSRNSAHVADVSHTVAASETKEIRNTQTIPQRAAASKSAEAQAAVAVNAAGPTGDELAATERTEVTTTSDEPARRESGPVTSRAPSRIEATVPVATPVAASPGGEPATAASENATRHSTNPTPAKTDGLVNVLGRHQPGASAAGRAHRAAGDDELPRVDPARFIGRVAKAFQTAQDRGGTLQLRLSPPELGSLRLELTVKEGVMTAALETETTAARRILLDHLPALRDRLAEQNIRVERFDVDVRREGNGGQADGRPAQQEQHDRQPDQAPPRRESAAQQRTTTATALELPVIRNPINDTQINLVA